MGDTSDEPRVLHYSRFHRVTAWISQRMFSNVTYTVNHGLLKGMRRRGGLGWLPEILAGSVETREHAFFRNLDLRGKVVYDVGAFVGLFALHCARQAKHVVCYEPMEGNRRRLHENLLLNDLRNVSVRPLGVGDARASMQMSFDPLMPGGASVDSSLRAGIESSPTSILTDAIEITTLDLDIVEAQLLPPDFIKIDIEGFEFNALQGARATIQERMPDLYLEMHGETMADKRRKVGAIVRLLEEYGYSDIVHVETGIRLTSANRDTAAEGHIFCGSPKNPSWRGTGG